MKDNNDPPWAHADLLKWLKGWDWRWETVQVIKQIEYGWLARYGSIATRVNARNKGFNITARNVAWLRRELYGWVRDGDEKIKEMKLPLHRVAKQGDVAASADSVETGEECRELRRKEGSLQRQRWWSPEPGKEERH